MDELHALNGSVSVTYSATASSATNRNSNFSDVIDVDFWFPEHVILPFFFSIFSSLKSLFS